MTNENAQENVETPLRVAIIGDCHLRFDARDVLALDAAGLDLILFVGDLGGYRSRGAETVARVIATLETPALVLPGNHDAVIASQLLSEALPQGRALRPLLSRGQPKRVHALDAALGDVPLGGYSTHAFSLRGQHLSVIAARPHSMGGPELGFASYLGRRFGIESITDSAQRLMSLIDATPDRRIVMLAHNGPTGLGNTPESIFGNDFSGRGGDWGDLDLRLAMEHARRVGKRLLAVAAGHMHHHVRGGGERPFAVMEKDTLIVNAARVPRQRRHAGELLGYHVLLTIDGDEVRAESRWLPLAR